jgi:hypothetical protein
MRLVLVVKVRADEVVGVVAVRHGLVAAAPSVDVTRVVLAARVRAAGRSLAGREHVLVHVIVVHAVQMPVVQEVVMVVVLDADVTAVCAVHVGMVRMRLVCHAAITAEAARRVKRAFARFAKC